MTRDLYVSDTLTISLVNGSTTHPVNLINTGIAWSTDVNSKFKNPDSRFSVQISSGFTAIGASIWKIFVLKY